jgi:hypothetical protein
VSHVCKAQIISEDGINVLRPSDEDALEVRIGCYACMGLIRVVWNAETGEIREEPWKALDATTHSLGQLRKDAGRILREYAAKHYARHLRRMREEEAI